MSLIDFEDDIFTYLQNIADKENVAPVEDPWGTPWDVAPASNDLITEQPEFETVFLPTTPPITLSNPPCRLSSPVDASHSLHTQFVNMNKTINELHTNDYKAFNERGRTRRMSIPIKCPFHPSLTKGNSTTEYANLLAEYSHELAYMILTGHDASKIDNFMENLQNYSKWNVPFKLTWIEVDLVFYQNQGWSKYVGC